VKPERFYKKIRVLSQPRREAFNDCWCGGCGTSPIISIEPEIFKRKEGNLRT
jgi:hypothetical protein